MAVTIAEVRAKYPQYDRLSDVDLADRLHAKFYPQIDRVDFYGRIGMDPATGPVSSQAPEPKPAGIIPAPAGAPMTSPTPMPPPLVSAMREGSTNATPGVRPVWPGQNPTLIPQIDPVDQIIAAAQQPGAPMAPPAAPLTAAQQVSRAMAAGPQPAAAPQAPGAPMMSPAPTPRPQPAAPDPFAGESIADLLARRGQQFASGAVEVAASTPEAAALTGESLDRAAQETAQMERERNRREQAWLDAALKNGLGPAGEPFAPKRGPDLRAPLSPGRRAEFEARLAKLKAVDERELTPIADGAIKPALDRDTFKAGDRMRAAAEEALGAPDPRDQTFWAALAQGAGNMTGMVVSTLAASAIGGPAAGVALGGAEGAAMTSSQMYKEALAAGADEATARSAASWGAGIGVFEIVPISRALKVLPNAVRGKITNAVLQKFAHLAESAGEEAAQEFMSQVAQNIAAKGLYDPERGWMDGAGEAALIGGILGTGVGSLGLATGSDAETGVTAQPRGKDEPEEPKALPAPPKALPAPAQVAEGAAQPAPPSPVDELVAAGTPQPEAAAPIPPEKAKTAEIAPLTEGGWEEVDGFANGQPTGKKWMHNAETGETISKEEYQRRVGEQAESQAAPAIPLPAPAPAKTAPESGASAPEAPKAGPSPEAPNPVDDLVSAGLPQPDETPSPEDITRQDANAGKPITGNFKIQAGDSDEMVDVTVDDKGGWDFNDRWPSPDPAKLAGRLNEGRDDGLNTPEDVQAILDETMNELTSHLATAEAWRQQGKKIKEGKKPDFRYGKKDDPLQIAKDNMDEARRAADDMEAAVRDLWSDEATDAVVSESKRRALAEVRGETQAPPAAADTADFPITLEGDPDHAEKQAEAVARLTKQAPPTVDANETASGETQAPLSPAGETQAAESAPGESIAADGARWDAMTPGQRDRFLSQINPSSKPDARRKYTGTGWAGLSPSLQARLSEGFGKGAHQGMEPAADRADWRIDEIEHDEYKYVVRRGAGDNHTDVWGYYTEGERDVAESALKRAQKDRPSAQVETETAPGAVTPQEAAPKAEEKPTREMTAEERGQKVEAEEASDDTGPELQDEWWGTQVKARKAAVDSGATVAYPDETKQHWNDREMLVAVIDRMLIENGFGDMASPIGAKGEEDAPADAAGLDAALNDLKASTGTPQKAASDGPSDAELGKPATVKLAEELAGLIARGEKLPESNMGLMKLASKHFGGTIAEGAFSPKDAYEAAELALNMTVQRFNKEHDAYDPSGYGEKRKPIEWAKGHVEGLENLLNTFPTQTRRDAETDAFQQFSTPPHYAYAVNWVANIREGDRVLEPSAGNGGIAIFAKNAGAKVDVNELAERRRPSLEALGFNRVTGENAEQIANIWASDPSRRYDVVVMNPPFSASAGRTSKNTSATGARHIEQALDLLKPGGRLVAIMGHTFAPGNKRVDPFFRKMDKDFTLHANVVVEGAKVYKKYGTGYDNRLLVIDKAPAPEGHETLTGTAGSIPELLDMMEGIRNVADTRRTADEGSDGDAGQRAGEESGPTADDGGRSRTGEPERVSQPDDLGSEGEGPGRGGRSPAADGGRKGAKGDRKGRAERGQPDEPDGGAGTAGGRGQSSGGGGRASIRLKEVVEDGKVEETGRGFAKYKPRRVRIEGAVEHPMLLVESSAMASVNPPKPTHELKLPEKMVKDGLLSEAQLEQVVYAGAAHAEMLPAMSDGEPQRRKGFYIGDGCVAGHTLVYDPLTGSHAPIKALAEAGEPINVLSLTSDGLRPYRADAPFRKGVAPLFRVTTERGREITVTQGHRFLTPDGWRTLSSGVRVGSLLASAPSLPGSSSERAPSVHAEGASHSQERPEDCFRRCSPGFHPDDGRPLSAVGSAPASAPSQGGALAHSLDCPRADGPAPSPEHSRAHPAHGRRSRSGFPPSHGPGQVAISGQAPASGAPHSPSTRRVPLQSHERGAGDLQVLEADRPCIGSPGDGSLPTGLEARRPCAEDASRPSRSKIRSDQRSQPSSLRPDTQHETSRLSQAMVVRDNPCLHDSGWDRITSIEFVEIAEFFDMHVPGSLNYVAEGLVNHNTGVGKTREIAGIIADNWANGRKKHILVSKDKKLLKSARRDFDNVGMKSVPIADLGGVKADGTVPSDQTGVLFTTYSTLSKGGAGKKSRIEQIIEWVGPDFDGTIIFDEAHLAGNAMPVKGKRGTSQPSKAALSVVELQKQLPNARVVYASATAATEVHNLAYADRLGVWGPGTPFPNVQSFVSQIDKGGIAAMEVVARDMKQMGVYMARTLSFEGVEYAKVEHELTAPQREMYDAAAEAWQTILANMHKVIEEHTQGGGRQRASALAQFWSAHQRFFGQVLTSMQMPTIIKSIEADVKAGMSPVIQIVNTNEAATNRAISKLEDGETLDDIDITPREDVIQFLETSFPIHQFEEFEDESGNISSRPALDSEGNIIVNATAVRIRDELVDKLAAMRLPGNPLDMIIESFGADNVAEVTGRSTRIVQKNGKKKTERRSQNKTLAEAAEYQAGKRKVLVFSDAGGTGMDFHADKGAKNKARRSHYVLQAGWRADRAIQGFGRTHRTNQVQPPIYKLAGTNLSGHKRFTSSIARRLDQLGALTKGQKDAGGGLFDATDNLESIYGEAAVTALFHEIWRGEIEGFTPADVERELGLSVVGEKGFNVSKIPGVTQFLNRLLNARIDRQNMLFERFIEHMEAAVQHAIDNDTFTAGVEEVKHDGASLKDTKEAFRDPATGATSEYRMVELIKKIIPVKFVDIDTAYANIRYKKHRDTGVVYAFRPASSRTNDKGEVIPTYHRHSVTDRQIIDSQDYQFKYEMVKADEAEEAWNKQYEEAPRTRTQTMHMVTGALLPIWDRLPSSSPKIVRLTLDDGRALLGREIPDVELTSTLENLGVTGPDIDMSPEEMQQAVLEQGKTILLSSGHRIERRKVGGEQRMEIIPPGDTHYEDTRPGGTLMRLGFQMERLNYKARFFAATGDKGRPALEAFMRGKSIVNVTMRKDARLDVFYSPLLRGLDGAKQKQAPAKDWKAIIGKLPGVKKAEIDWIGVEDWLDAQDGQIPREAVADFVRANQIELDEVERKHGEKPDYVMTDPEPIEPDWAEEAEQYLDEARAELLDEAYAHGDQLAEIDDDEVQERAEEMARRGWESFEYKVTLYDRNGVGVDFEGTWDGGKFYFDLLDRDGYEDSDSAIEAAKYEAEQDASTPNHEGYTEEGGTNYRELLLTVPNLHQTGKNKPATLTPRLETIKRRIEAGLATPAEAEEYRLKAGPISEMSGGKRPFVQRSHFEEENIVVHARVKDRKAGADKVLFVEEIQSDLASKWREVESPEITAKRRELDAERRGEIGRYDDWVERATPVVWQYFQDNNYSAVPPYAALADIWRVFVRGHMAADGGASMAVKALRERDGELYDEVKRMAERARERQREELALGTEKTLTPGTPNTPFKEEATYALMVKRLIREAAEKGYDRLAWTPGYMQAERWNSAAQSVVEEVNWYRVPSGVKGGSLTMAGGSDIVFGVNETNGEITDSSSDELIGKPLADLIGPKLAKQVLSEESGTVTGQKITFPDSGYAIAYDQQIRKAVEKFAKKFGGKVEVATDLNDMQGQRVSDGADDPRPVWSVKITPEMREAAMKPQPILMEGKGRRSLGADEAPHSWRALRRELDKMGLHDVDLKFDPTFMHEGMAEADHWGKIAITIGKTVNPHAVLGHESIHVFKHMGLFTHQEWALLEAEARASWVERYNIAARYPELPVREQYEEAIAEAFGEAYEAKKQPFRLPSGIREAFRKVANFIKAVRNWAKGLGLTTEAEVFDALARGDFAKRRPTEKMDWLSQAERLAKEKRRQRTPAGLHIPDRYLWDALVGANMDIFARAKAVGGAVSDRFDLVRTRIQDRFLPVRRAQEVIERQLGAPVPEDLNAYLAEEMYSGRAGYKLDHIDHEYTTKIIGIIGGTKDMTVETVGRYLYARHAKERNQRIADINPDMQDGGSGMSDAEADAILAAIAATPQASAYEDIGKLVDDLREWGIQERVDMGLMTKTEAAIWRRSYMHYVPLKGWAETDHADAELDVSGIGRGYNVRGVESKMALGRQSEAFNPLVAAITQAQEVAVRSEKNRVGQHLYRLAKEVPAKGLWEVKRAETRRVFNETTGLVEERSMQPISLLQAANEMAVKVDGKEHRIIFNDPRLARAAMQVGVDQLGAIMRPLSMFGRYISAMNTMLDPEFVIRNFARDTVTANINIQSKEMGTKIQKGMMKDLPKALGGAWRGLGGKADTDWSRYFQEFSAAGGKVSFWTLENPESNQSTLEKRLHREAGGWSGVALSVVTPSTELNPVLRGIERVNLAVDNAIRLSAFVHARKNGMTEQRAASLAKNLTVNFNRRGDYGSAINAAYVFANAATQGTQIMFKALKSRRVQLICTGLAILGYLLDQANAYLSDEDDDGQLAYDKIPDYKFETSLVLMRGLSKGEADDAFTLWLPYGFNIFPYIGNRVSRLQRGLIDGETAMGDTARTAFNAFSPVNGQSFMALITPTALDPAVEVYGNEDWLGRPIYPDYPGMNEPQSQRFFGGATDASRIIAEKMNAWTGGTYAESGYVDVSPEVIDHISAFLTGGVGRLFGRMTDLFSTVAQGETPEANDIPFARSLYTDTGEWMDRSLYFDRRAEIEAAHDAAKAYHDHGDPIPTELIWKAKLYPVLRQAEKHRKGTGGVKVDEARAFLLLNSGYVRAWKQNTPYSSSSIFGGR